jgi:hypothetical protein
MKVTKQQSTLLPSLVTINIVAVGKPVWDIKAKRMIMKVKPTGFLLNSNIVADVSQRGDCFVCALKEGTVYAVTADRQVQEVNSELVWSE